MKKRALTKEQTALINHYGWTVKGVKRLPLKTINRIYTKLVKQDAHKNFEELKSPFLEIEKQFKDKKVAEIYRMDQRPRRYRKQGLKGRDIALMKPEFQRGRGDKYGYTYKTHKDGYIERGPVGTL